MPKENETPRKRAKNFTAEEEVLLVELVEVHKNCIENKKSDAVIWRQKEEAWKKIEKTFVATIGIHRHWKALRDKYEVIKRKSKSENAVLDIETYLTSKGVSSAKINTISTKIAYMLGDSATGLQCEFDSDSITENSKCLTDLESNIGSIEVRSTNECSKGSDIVEDKGGYESDSSTWKTSTLKNPKSKDIIVGVKKKRSAEEEKLELIILQQQFYRDENLRAQEKHEQELIALKLKNELLQLELAEKKEKIISGDHFHKYKLQIYK